MKKTFIPLIATAIIASIIVIPTSQASAARNFHRHNPTPTVDDRGQTMHYSVPMYVESRSNFATLMRQYPPEIIIRAYRLVAAGYSWDHAWKTAIDEYEIIRLDGVNS